jgi:hypothetical protein
MRGKQNQPARSQALALALLCLIAHALFVSFTHDHIAGREQTASSTLRIGPDDCGSSHHAPGSHRDAHCLSCQLQRNFIAALRQPSVAFEPTPEAVSREVFLSPLYSRGSPRVLSDRAPPLA